MFKLFPRAVVKRNKVLVHMRWQGLPAVRDPPLVDAVSSPGMYILYWLLELLNMISRE